MKPRFGFSTQTDVQDYHQFNPTNIVEKLGVYSIYQDQRVQNEEDIGSQVRDIAKPFSVELAFSLQVSWRLYSQQGEQAATTVNTIVNCKKPRASYVVHSNKRKNFILTRLLPKRLVDRLVFKSLNKSATP